MNILCSAGKGETSKDDCLACALENVIPPCGYDYSLLKALYDDPERTGIHVTHLTGCLRKAYLDITSPRPEYPHEMLTRTLGTAIHQYLETEDEHMQTEMPVKALGIVGTSDVVYNDGRVLDHKTTRWIYPHKLPYGSHELQVNIYAHLLREMGREVSSLAIQYIDVSGPTKCRKCRVPVRPGIDGPICPSCGKKPKNAHLGVVTVEVPLWDPKEVQAFLDRRYPVLEKALDGGGEPPAEPGYLCAYCAHVARCPEGQRQVSGK